MRNLAYGRELLAACLIVGMASQAMGSSMGKVGLTNDTMVGCNQCHSGGATPTVTLSGPTQVLPGSVSEYLLEIFEIGSQTHGGLDIGATAGSLSLGGSHPSVTQILSGEVTHTAAKAGDGTSVKFSFLWTAPNMLTSETLHGWGNAVNFSGTNSGDAASYVSLGVDVVNGHDVVVLAAPALNVTLPTTSLGVTKKIKVKVRNADPTGAPPQLIALSQTNDCPGSGVTISQPDFDPSTPLSADTQITLDPGKTATATVTINVTPAAFITFNHLAPNRCTMSFVASFPMVMGNLDPSTSNNASTVELNVIDKSDPEQSTTHETALASLKPLSINIPKLKTSKTSKAMAVVRNADFLPVAETPGHDVTLAIDLSSCPWLSAAPIDFIAKTPAVDNPITVKGGKTAAAAIAITADATQVTTSNKSSPLRCVATVTATGPTDQQPDNNSSKIVIDVIDKNDF
ncbi:MAG: hypothetical protein HY270_21665 [Deltaproteobacteria bacterium]|nr:hypothetical protein [Deltaproteobacteria bacterium]